MTRDQSIIELGAWLTTPAGRYLLGWEQDRLDHAVADVFGFHALQLGLPELDGLRANRMPHRWVAADGAVVPDLIPMPPPDDERITTAALPLHAALHCEPEALPFPDQSLDLVLLPHTLELASDPHLTLAEVTRVLRPEGRVVIVGLNPTSLWGLRQRLGHVRQQLGWRRSPLYLPETGEFIGYWRARDCCACWVSRSNGVSSGAIVHPFLRPAGWIVWPGSRPPASAGGRQACARHAPGGLGTQPEAGTRRRHRGDQPPPALMPPVQRRRAASLQPEHRHD